MDSRAARPGEADRGDLAFTLAVAAVALLPRLFVALAWAREPVWDGHYYHYGAERIAAGLGYSEDVVIGGHAVWKPWTHYPVGYSALLGGVYRIFGSSLVVAPLVNVVIGALLVVGVHRLGRYFLSRDRARVAAGLVALHPGLIAYAAVVMNEPLSALLVVWAGWAALRWRGGWQALAAAGVLLGLAALVRPSTLAALPLLALTQPRPWYAALARAAVAGALALLVVLPWTLRNCARMDGCALVSTNGGWNLAIGALTETGRFRALHARDGCPVVTGQVQQDRCWAEVGRRTIAADPGRWLRLVPAKLAHTYDHESFAIEYLREASPERWPEPRRAAGRRLLTLFHRLLMLAASLSVVAWAFKRRGAVVQGALAAGLAGVAAYAVFEESHPFWVLAVAWPLVALAHLPGRPEHGPAGRYLLGLVAVTTSVHAVFFGDDRYHLVVTPALCLLAAAALRRPRRSALPPDAPTPAARPGDPARAPG